MQDYCEPGLIRAALLKELLSPAPRHLCEITAELLIVAGQYIWHEGEGRDPNGFLFVSEESVRRAFSDQDIDTGDLPVGTVRWGNNGKGTWLIQWIPPGRHTIQITGNSMPAEPISIPLPGLLFAGMNTNYYVWASREKQYSPRMTLYHAPLPNVSERGAICYGSNQPPLASSATLEEAWRLFIESEFNDHYMMRKSLREPGDIRTQLCRMRKKQQYPVSDLLPTGREGSGFDEPLTVPRMIERFFQQKSSI